MKIIFIIQHICTRAMKQAQMLSNLGYDIHLLCEKYALNYIDHFKTMTYFKDAISLRDALSLFDDSYIFHVHNEPSWMATVVRDKFPKARIVFDAHDSNYWRIEGNFSWYEEDVAIQSSDAIVFTSETMANTIKDFSKPSIVLPSAISEIEYRYGPWMAFGGLVSEGGHTMPQSDNPLEGWRDYTILYTLLKDRAQVYAYSGAFHDTDNEISNHYLCLNCNIAYLPYHTLLDRMGCHDWSLCGNLGGDLVWRRALPNKFFDAMCSGVPVINIGCAEVANIINEYGVGININHVDEIFERWNEHLSKRQNVFKHRKEMALERYIPRLENLYKEL